MDVSAVAPFSNVECPACGKHTRVKREFGPYTLLRRHAIGGMSVVFVAHDNTLDREVALKILNEDYSADEKRITAFEEEARVTASFSHPHVVRLLTTGKAFGRYYLAMELVSGGHFEHQIRERGALPEQEVLTLAIQVAEGLQAAHAAGLIHRDIKPGNILLDAAGNAKIVDFGLALVTKGGKAQAEEIWATPYYVPPEAIDGLPEDFRSDLYAFGATLYHALAGKPSCNEESMVTTVLKDAKRNVQPLATAAPWLTPETCAVVDKAMAYEVEERFSSYEELLAALRFALQRAQSGPAQPPPETAAMRRRREAKKRERIVYAAGAGLLILAVGVAVVKFARSSRKPVPPPVDVVVDTPLDAGPQVNPEVAARVGRNYRGAREAVQQRDYESARKGFAEVRDDPEVMEPTGSWAGVEAVIAPLLDGGTAEARGEATLSLEHLKKGGSGDADIGKHLIPAMERIGEFPSVAAKSLDPGKARAPEMMAWMLMGLKDWEQGKWDDAAAFFKGVTEVRLKEPEGWARLYQAIAKRYLEDHESLSAGPGDPPADVAACKAKIEELDKLHAGLKTKGRARFNVREWQLTLARRAKELESAAAAPQVPSGPAFAEERAAAEVLCRDLRFTEALEKLKASQTTGNEVPAREAWISLIESASGFLTELETDLGTGEVITALQSRDGSASFTGIGLEGPGKLKVSDGTGGSREITWRDLAPESVIDLHRQIVRTLSDDTGKWKRHAGAIAFDWLAGDRARARSAGERLAQENPDFKPRWDLWVAGVKSPE